MILTPHHTATHLFRASTTADGRSVGFCNHGAFGLVWFGLVRFGSVRFGFVVFRCFTSTNTRARCRSLLCVSPQRRGRRFLLWKRELPRKTDPRHNRAVPPPTGGRNRSLSRRTNRSCTGSANERAICHAYTHTHPNTHTHNTQSQQETPKHTTAPSRVHQSLRCWLVQRNKDGRAECVQ